ncbi:sensor histidine kinase [Lentzea rhizosphaerae]|uniref:Sensor histidine kinase n=1 Tax=Lentzea rhizosphaerae TaxID=2041025 RepID=A0ABV8BMB5_9PSEU
MGGEVAVAGEATRLLERFGRRCAAVVRVATLPPVIAVGLLRAYPERLWPTLLVVVVAAAWTCGCAWRLSRERARPPVTADAAVLLAVCLIALWSGAVDGTNTGWLRLLVTFACVTWQWHTPPLAGAVAALVTGGGMLVTIDVAGPDVHAGQIWVLAMAALSRAVWVLVTRAARRADRMAAVAEEVRRASAVAAAVRDEERELANALHDTAATTLLMVGTGQVRADATWLAAQAGRDLARLRSRGDASPAAADLVGLLRDDADSTHLTVDLDAPDHLVLPFDVASAIAGAAREALNNVRRHAGTDRATVRVRGDARELCVEIVDAGRGFSAEAGPARRGLRESVHGRMNRVGGTATITSSAGTGTTVRLEWRAERG